jgi:hypothetical protein
MLDKAVFLDFDAYDVPPFGAKSIIIERYGIGEVNHFRPDGTNLTEKGILLIPDQDPALLPGWQPLAC